jgi:hypothetical protein
MNIDFHKVRDLLQAFDFQKVFVEELGWSNPPKALRATTFKALEIELSRKAIAELSGFVVFEVTQAAGDIPNAKVRAAAHKAIGALHHEHVLVFVDRARQKSVWSWIRRREGKDHPRTHYYFRGQPGDLFIGKLGALMFELGELDAEGNVSIVKVAEKVRAALDVERVTRRFYSEFKEQHEALAALLTGVQDERQRRWYASVLLNRLMFIYFLQKKGFLDGKDLDYLSRKLTFSREALGPDRYFKDFLWPLFFEGFAKPEDRRSAEARERLGKIRYLNGGLFLPHRVELDNPAIDVPDKAFEDIFALFGRYTWHLDDTPGGDDSTINPDVLGYIFEKYINQKSFGAYYTPPEITDWLCEQTIHRAVLDRVNMPEELHAALPEGTPARFDDVSDLLLHLTPSLCQRLLRSVLPSLSILDPACGSGAFLVAALKSMHALYGAVVGAVKTSADKGLKDEVAGWEREHASLGYFLKKRIITDNLFGVDIMEEATEIARLRLFLALVSSAVHEEDLEPLPNVDFNIMAGNSLVGLLHVKDEEFERHDHGAPGTQLGFGFRARKYREILEEKNRLIRVYRSTAEFHENLSALREEIEAKKSAARKHLDEILREKFMELGIRYEEPTWDDKKNDAGKSRKRQLRTEDIRALQPFHWGYEHDERMETNGGFDVILANPPWEVFKPNAKEFFQEHSNVISKNNMRIEDFEKEQKRLLGDPEVRRAWLEYLARFPHVNDFFRKAPQYENQAPLVTGKRAGTDLNLYKLFFEQCFNLLRKGGQLGMVVPASLYSDIGAARLRRVLFDESELHALFGFSNERFVFENVHHSFKICLFAAGKGGKTERFDAAFRINPREAIDIDHIAEFLRDRREHIEMTPAFVRQTSPESLSIMELKSGFDVAMVHKMLRQALLGAEIDGSWKLDLCRELHMTDDHDYFKNKAVSARLPLYEGKMIHQYDWQFAAPRYWIDKEDVENALRPARVRRAEAAAGAEDMAIDEGAGKKLSLDCHAYRLAFREVARNTDERSMICAVLPPHVVTGHTLVMHRPFVDVVRDGQLVEELTLQPAVLLYVAGVLNSFVADWFLRQRISAHLTMFQVYQLPVPRLTEADVRLAPIALRAAKLTCTTAEFDDLARSAGLHSHENGVTDPEARAQLRAEIDGLVAHLYGLTEEELAHVLRTFPVVPEPVREAARSAYRAVARGDVK